MCCYSNLWCRTTMANIWWGLRICCKNTLCWRPQLLRRMNGWTLSIRKRMITTQELRNNQVQDCTFFVFIACNYWSLKLRNLSSSSLKIKLNHGSYKLHIIRSLNWIQRDSISWSFDGHSLKKCCAAKIFNQTRKPPSSSVGNCLPL